MTQQESAPLSGPGSHPSTALAKWGDTAMWSAEPIDNADRQHGVHPTVYLLGANADPLGTVAAVSRIYRGGVARSLLEVTDDERSFYFDDMRKSRLRAPFEFVKFHFLIEGVSRGFTHQMVRQRTATFGQESLRFAVKEDLGAEMHIPPTIAGLKDDDPRRVIWDKTVDAISKGYMTLVDAGIPAEDARGLLPTNVATRLHYTTDLNSLMAHAGNRLCTQAQFEWRFVWAAILKALRQAHTDVYAEADGITKIYRANDLLQLFRPICYQTGKCEFMASLDRHCSIRDRVQANAGAGIGSADWGTDHAVPGGFSGNEAVIPAIRDEEWLLDTRAARG